MLTFILLGAGAIVIVFLVALAWGANNRKRAGQASAAMVNASKPSGTGGRATPPIE